MSDESKDDQNSSDEDQQQGQSATDSPDAMDNPAPKAGAVDHLKTAFAVVKRFISRQKLPTFLVFYRDHWQDLLRHVRDGLSQPAVNELWIRGSDPSPGVFREEHAWDIDASTHCVICGRQTDEPRRRVRSVVRDYDGMAYGLLFTVVVMIVVRFATASSIAAVGSLFVGLWCARRLIVEEKVRIDCSTCAEHAGREATLPLRLKRDTLIVELGGRKARTVFLRKLRDTSASTAWEDRAPATGQSGSLPAAFGAGDDETDSPPAEHPTGPPTDWPVDSTGTDSAVDQTPARIQLADSDDANPVEFRTFAMHDSDSRSIDAPTASQQESRSKRPSHYFQSKANDSNETGGPSAAHSPTTEPTDNQPGGSARDHVLIPDSAGPSETFSLSGGAVAASEPDGHWFAKIDGVEIGPVPLEQIRRLKASGTLKQTDLVRRSEESTWSGSDSIPAAEASPSAPLPVDEKTPQAAGDPWSAPKDDSDAPWDPWAE